MAVIKKRALIEQTNRRAEERAASLFVMQVILLSPLDRSEFDVECLNTSPTGIAFRSPVAFRIGEKVAVKMRFCNRDGHLMLCQVRHCSEGPGNCRVGARILQAITAEKGTFQIPAKWLPEI